ncbi:hypothetical protein ACFQU9_00130 [Actinomadura namibiensis]|uniref:hypothetical protein n=1 Tax=Actinomadura kijaniata TaxID=46161 RepID=UPI00360B7355
MARSLLGPFRSRARRRREAEIEGLFVSTVTRIGYRDAFFLWPEHARNAFAASVRDAARRDPEWTAAFLEWLRTATPMRYPALVGAAAFVAERRDAGLHGMSRRVVGSVLRRADDPGYLLAHWVSTYGRAVPKPVKRGVADAVVRLYDEAAARSCDTAGHRLALPSFAHHDLMNNGGVRVPRPFRFGQVIRLVHPVARDERQNAVFRRALDGRRPAPGRAGRPSGDGWERIAPLLPLEEVLHGLRRMDAAGLPFEAAMEIAERLGDADAVRAAGLGPVRIAAAWRAVADRRWAPALERAAGFLLEAMPRIPGRTLIALDHDHPGSAVFGLALARLCASADVVTLEGGAFPLVPGESPLHALHRWRASDLPSPGRSDWAAVRKAFAGHDRVVVVDDWIGSLPEFGVPSYAWQTRHGGVPEVPGWLTFQGRRRGAAGHPDDRGGAGRRVALGLLPGGLSHARERVT